MKRPSFQFYPSDWLRDTALRSCSTGARGLWMDMICFMHEGTPYGHLKVGDKVILPSNLARMVGDSAEVVSDWLLELSQAGVYETTEDGVIYSKRMIRDENLRQIRAAGGSKGVMNRMSTPAAAVAETAKLPNIGTTPAADTGVRTFGLGEQAAPIARTPMGIEGLAVDMGPNAAPFSAQVAPFKTVGFQGDGVTPLTQAQFDRAIQAPIQPSASTIAAAGQTGASAGTPLMRTGFDPKQAATLRPTPTPTLPDAPRSLVQKGLDRILPGRIEAAGKEAAEKAFTDTLARTGSETLAQKAYDAAMPGMIRQFAPLAATGLGIMALGGGFKEEETAPPEGFEDFMSGIPLQKEEDRLRYGGVNTTAFSNLFNPYSYTPPAQPQGRAKGGSMDKEFPRKTGPINGPGTGTSDDIPAMLSDGEFVFTAKAVRGMGNGSRRAGAKKMYALMRKLEGRKNG